MRTSRAICCLLPVILLPLRSADFAWTGRGIISLPEPAGWSVQGRPTNESAYNFRGVPKSEANAKVLITLLDTPQDRVVNPAVLKQALLDAVRPRLDRAVEKAPEPQKIKMRQGGGWFVELTDSALVGKPPARGNFKVARSAMLALDAHALVIATMFFDDPKGPEPAAMLEMVRGLRLRRTAAAEAIAMTAQGGRIRLTTPQSRVVLSLPEGKLAPEPIRASGGTANPRYFLMHDAATGLNVSGWLEPANEFPGLKVLWARDRERMIKAGVSAPQDESFTKVADWEVVFYTITAGNDQVTGSFLNCRAHWVRDGTWTELHLSVPVSDDAKARLTAFLESARVEAKP